MTTPSSSQSVRLWHAITDAPPEVEAMASTLGFERFAHVRSGLYVSWDPQRFDRAKFNANIEEIKAICDGADWISTDLEGLSRRIVRRPSDYSRTELKWAKWQFTSMWWAFRDVFPDVKIVEYDFPMSWRAGQYHEVDWLVLEYLDGFSPSIYWQDTPSWERIAAGKVNYALAMGRNTNRPVFPWVTERFKSWNDEHTVATYELLAHDDLTTMVDFATTGTNGVIYWTYTLRRAANGNPARIIPETLRPGYTQSDLYPGLAILMAETRTRQRQR